jgi:uncharacterized protein YukE
MRGWDLTTGRAKLDLALDALRKANAAVAEHWDDQTHRQFEEQYVLCLDPQVKRTLEAIKRMEAELRKAERECSPS